MRQTTDLCIGQTVHGHLYGARPLEIPAHGGRFRRSFFFDNT